MILLSVALIDFNSIFEKNRDLDVNVDFSWLTLFWSLHNTTIAEVLSSYVNKNRDLDNGGK